MIEPPDRQDRAGRLGREHRRIIRRMALGVDIPFARRPLAFGRVNQAAFFGLPGNPVAVMVAFYQFVQPALQHMMGEHPASGPPLFRARSLSRFRKQPGRTEFQRALVETDASGELVVRSTGTQGSGILRSMSSANCFVVLADDDGDIEPGATVMVQPFFGLMR